MAGGPCKMIVNPGWIRALAVPAIDGNSHEQPRSVGRRLNVQYTKLLEHGISALGQYLLESFGHLVAQLYRLAVQPRASLSAGYLCAGSQFTSGVGIHPVVVAQLRAQPIHVLARYESIFHN
jgi:hypothetical protein